MVRKNYISIIQKLRVQFRVEKGPLERSKMKSINLNIKNKVPGGFVNDRNRILQTRKIGTKIPSNRV